MQTESPLRSSRALLRRFPADGVLPAIIVLMGVFIQLQNPAFFTTTNLVNILRQSAILAILAFGMTAIIITGNIDLSTGSIIGLSSVLSSDIMLKSGSIALGMAVAMAAGLTVGLLNGLVLVRSGVHPFLVTLGTGMIYKGIAYIYTQGMPIANLPKAYLNLGSTSLFGIPLMTIVAAVVFFAVAFLLTRTRFGLHLYEIGGREEAAVAAGIDVKRVKVLVYGLAGLLTGIASLLVTIRVISSHASLGTNYHLQAIGASVVGGASLSGGRGKLLGTVYGVLIMGILSNGLNLLKVSSFWQEVAIGATIVVAVVIDNIRTDGGKA